MTKRILCRLSFVYGLSLCMALVSYMPPASAVAHDSQKKEKTPADYISPSGAKFEIVSTTPPTKKEKQNKGTRMLATTIKSGKSKQVRIIILLKSVGENWKKTPAPKIRLLAGWKGKKLK